MDEQSGDESTMAGDDDILAPMDNPYQHSTVQESSRQVLTDQDYGISLDSHGRLNVSEQLLSLDIIGKVQ